ncbi:MAG: ABC transporter ATP-binding protein [Caldilineaceae bacterium]|nr:ABC transporter ATP-binding protein [Caldilineaceae bacterium]
MSEAAFLVVDQVRKDFVTGNSLVKALSHIVLTVHAGEFVCLLGPSGSGKSTLLRIIGGLLPADSGTVSLLGERLSEPHPDIGFVFQGANLMPWRTVLNNVLLPAEVQRGTVAEADCARARALLTLVGLHDFVNAYPQQLSGGMKQRVVLARTLFQRPKLLLMDEPFGALDALTRERLNLELLRIYEEHRMTVLMVTHSIPEAVFLADRVVVLSERPGRVVADVAIDLPRPRELAMMGDEHFGRLTMAVRGAIG